MDPFDQQIVYTVASGALLLGGLAFIVWAVLRGWLTSKSLIEGPRRPAGLSGLTVILALATWFVGTVAYGAIVYPLIVPGDTAGDFTNLTSEQTAAVVPSMQLLSQGAAVALVLLVCLRRPLGIRRLGLDGHPPLRTALRGIVAGVACLCVVAVVSTAVALIASAFGREQPAVDHVLLESMRGSQEFWVVLALTFSAVALAPLLEEILFRGLIQTALLHHLGYRARPVILVLAAALFALIHLEAVSWFAMPALFVLGLMFGAIYERTGNLWLPIIAHATFNAFQLLFTLVLLPAEL